MKRAVTILSYVLGIWMLLGGLFMAGDGEMDGVTFVVLALVLAQTICTLVYIHDKK